MGIQAASIGAGMFLETTLSGMLGSNRFENVYYVHSIGFVSLILLAIFLPDTGKVKVTSTERIKLNAEVFKISALGLLEFMFLITFMTNISMHISQGMAGGASVSGIVTGLFSGSQIVIGLVLGMVTKVTKKYSLQVAMLSFALGAYVLVLFPTNLVMLVIGAILCGFSQGMFVPQAMCDISNAVGSASTTMAVACLTCAFCIGQLISPTILNTASKLILGNVTTSNVYLLSAIAMTVIGLAGILKQAKTVRNGNKAVVEK
jgi:MFS family permease